MAFTLSDNATVRYSAGERSVFALLPKSGATVSTSIILAKAYKDKREPFNGRKIILSALNSLVRKIEYNDEPFRLKKTERSGPIPMRFWLEKK